MQPTCERVDTGRGAETAGYLGRWSSLGIAALALVCAASVAAQPEQQYLFDVWLGDQRIGTHEVTVSGDQAQRVESEARFEVKALFLTLYRYEHVATEHWQGDCLSEFSSRTRDGGTDYRVSASATDAGTLAISSWEDDEKRESREDCAASFAYWNPELLDRQALLNSQTGTVEPVRLSRMGLSPLPTLRPESATAVARDRARSHRPVVCTG